MAGAGIVVGEPPEGSALRRTGLVADRDGNEVCIAWEYLRANTSSVVVDAGTPLAELTGGFDAVVLDVQGELTEVRNAIAAARQRTPRAGGGSHHPVRLHRAQGGMAGQPA